MLQHPQLSVPKEIWRLADYIFKNGLDAEGLFVTAGEAEEMEKIRDCLDEGRDFDFQGSNTAIHSVCETLVRLLESLPEPVVPFNLYQRCLDSYQTYQLAKQAVSQISTIHYNVFVYLTAFLREVISHSNKNGLTSEGLGMSPILLSSCCSFFLFLTEQNFPRHYSPDFRGCDPALSKDCCRKVPRGC